MRRNTGMQLLLPFCSCCSCRRRSCCGGSRAINARKETQINQKGNQKKGANKTRNKIKHTKKKGSEKNTEGIETSKKESKTPSSDRPGMHVPLTHHQQQLGLYEEKRLSILRCANKCNIRIHLVFQNRKAERYAEQTHETVNRIEIADLKRCDAQTSGNEFEVGENQNQHERSTRTKKAHCMEAR
jgi:hypothetical protein